MELKEITVKREGSYISLEEENNEREKGDEKEREEERGKVPDEEGIEIEEVTIKGEGGVLKVGVEGEDGVVKIGMEGEGGVEGLIDNFGGGGGGERSKEKWEGKERVTGEDNVQVKRVAMKGDSSWMDLEDDKDKEEKGVRGRKMGMMDCRREDTRMEGATVEGKSSWTDLEKEDEKDKWMKRKERRDHVEMVELP